MTNIRYGSNSNNRYKVTEYNLSCAGKSCKNTPTHFIKLALINRSGWFCQTCMQNLQKDDLVESIFKESVVIGGENSFEGC
jgi:hypothetical protein